MSVFSNAISAAPEEAEAYIKAVLGLLGQQDPLEVLRATSDQVRKAVAGRTPSQLRQPEKVGKWSAIQLVQHLADSDLVWAYRMRLVAAEDRPRLVGYDQDLWAKQLGYQNTALNDAIDQFESIRKLNLKFLERLGPDAFVRVGVHSERGEERLDHMVRLYAGHDLVHLRQLTRILGAA
jgi:uncharacterized damage-inducible protein DinB